MEPNMRNDEVEIDLKELMLTLLSKAWIILFVAVVCAGGCFALATAKDVPTYVSETKVYILAKSSEGTVTQSDLSMGSSLALDYQELITSRPVMEAVIKDLGLSYSSTQLAKLIKVSFPTNTRVVTIAVEDTSPTAAMNIANSVRTNASKHIKKVMDIQAVNVVEDASFPIERQPSNVKKMTLIGALLGAFVVIGVVTIRFLLDDSIKTPEDIETYLGLTNLGSIPTGEVSFITKTKTTGERG